MLLRPQHSIDAGEVHVWHVQEENLGSLSHETMQMMVPPEEIARMRRFTQERDLRLFLLSRVLMRSVLASYLQCDCGEIRLNTTPFGKPILASGETLHFNLTHSRGCAALAVSRDREVGVDIEERVRRVDYLGLAQRYFAAEEARHLAALPDDQRPGAFFAIWTLKEAYVKGIGRGLTFPLDVFAFELEVSRLVGFRALADFVACDWQFHQFELGKHHCGAVAVQGSDARIHMYDWTAAFLTY